MQSLSSSGFSFTLLYCLSISKDLRDFFLFFFFWCPFAAGQIPSSWTQKDAIWWFDSCPAPIANLPEVVFAVGGEPQSGQGQLDPPESGTTTISMRGGKINRRLKGTLIQWQILVKSREGTCHKSGDYLSSSFPFGSAGTPFESWIAQLKKRFGFIQLLFITFFPSQIYALFITQFTVACFLLGRHQPFER